MGAPFSLTRDESRRVDQLAIDEYGIPGMVLMENAGRGVVDVLLEADPALAARAAETEGAPRGAHSEGVALRQEGEGPRAVGADVVILCGKGNNAGDGFVIARHLEIRGASAKAILLMPAAELAGDARQNYDILVRCGLAVVDLSPDGGGDLAQLPRALDQHASGARWVVDAMLGTGAVGEPREPIRTAIAWMNAAPARRLAVDVPSGLDCDWGIAAGAAVRADVTCTFAAAKPGLLLKSAAAFVGELHVVSIGAPRTILERAKRG